MLQTTNANKEEKTTISMATLENYPITLCNNMLVENVTLSFFVSSAQA